jgi:protein-disulfide isomerase
MASLRLTGAFLLCMFANLNMTGCRSPGEGEPTAQKPATQGSQPKNIELPGVDSSDLTPREKAQWSAHVSELFAPCPQVASSVAACVLEKKDCPACLPAAEYLLSQVRQGRTPGQTEAAFEARFAADTKVELDAGDSPSKGADGAPIVIVEFADFECPACRAAAIVLDAIVAKSSDVRLVFKNYPLTNIHLNAEDAARAAVAAGRQGKFWEMHHELFTTEPPLTPERIKGLAKKVGLDVGKFETDTRSEGVVDAVRADQKLGQRVKLEATPSIYVNGRRVDVVSDLAVDLEAWIELERKLLSQKK